MADEPNKDQPQKSPEVTDKQKPPEGQKQEVSPDQQIHAEARAEWKGLLSDVETGRLQKIKERKQQIDDEQKKLKDNTPGKKSKESWTDNPSSSPVFDPKGKISEAVEGKSPRIKAKLDAMELSDDTNLGIVKQVLKDIVYDHYTKTGKDEDITKSYADNVLDDKISYLFDELKKFYDSKKHPFAKPGELIENFSDFTGTNFFKSGYMRADALKELFLMEKSSYENFIANFSKYHELGFERKQLDGEETTLTGKTLEPKELIDQKRISFNKTRITVPKDAKDLDKVLQEEITKALPPIADDKVKQKIVDYLAGEAKKLNPQPDEVFELSPDGKWTKIDVSAENKTKDDAKTDAEKQAAESATTSAEESKPFNLGDTFKNLWQGILDFLKWIFSALGLKFGSESADDYLKEWKDITETERSQIKEFYAVGKKYFSKMDNVNSMLKSPEETRRFLSAKKDDTKENESWDGWIQRHLSEVEKGEISGSTPIDAKGVADRLVSANTASDTPAQPLQQGPNEASPDSPRGRAQLLGRKLETAPYASDLKDIIDNYIQKKGGAETKGKMQKAQGGSRMPMDGTGGYIELLAQDLLKSDAGIREKFQKGQINELNLLEGIFDKVFGFAETDAKTPEEKQKINSVLQQFKATLSETLAERGKPGGQNQPPQSGAPKPLTS